MPKSAVEMGNYCIQNVHLRKYIVGYTVGIMFFGSVRVLEQNLIPNHIPDDLPPQMKILNSYFLNVTHFGVDISLFLENL